MFMPSHVGILMMLIAQGRGDLLDYVPTDAYWDSKHAMVTVQSLTADLTPNKEKVDISSELAQLGSDQFAVREAARQKIEAAGAGALEQLREAQTSTEPEVARVAKELSAKYAGKNKAQAVRQLMAIRTLGERKEKAALPALGELEKSKDPFIAEYAHRAVLQIQDKPLPVTVDAAQADADIWLFPKNTGIMLQERATAPVGLTLAKMAENTSELLLTQMGTSKEKLVQDATQGIIDAAEQVGDVRFDGVTLGVADDVGGNSGWAAFVGRGKFDPDALGAFLETSQDILPRGNTKKSTEGNVKIYEGQNLVLMISSDDRVVVIGGPSSEKMGPAKEGLLKALQTGKGDLAESEEMAKAIKQIDTKNSLLWGVMAKIPQDLKTELQQPLPVLAALDSATAGIVLKDGVLHFSIEGTGSDKATLGAGVDSVNANIAQSLAAFRQMPVGMADSLKPMIEVMETIKAVAADQKATLTGDVKVDTLALGVGLLYNQLHQMDAHVEAMTPAEVTPAAAPN